MGGVPAMLEETSFAVLDVETTGFSPLNGDRIVEVAVVRLGADGTEEYVTLVNPLRDVGPAHIHGLTADDVASAPMFQEIVGDVLEIMNGAVLNFVRAFRRELTQYPESSSSDLVMAQWMGEWNLQRIIAAARRSPGTPLVDAKLPANLQAQRYELEMEPEEAPA